MTTTGPRSSALLLLACGCRIGFDAAAPVDGRTADGTYTWRVEDLASGLRFYDVHGITANDVYAVGLSDAVWHFDGATWTAQPAMSNALFGIHGGSGSLYAVGRADGLGGQQIFSSSVDGTWTRETNAFTSALNKSWVVAPDDIYVAGYNGIIGHSTGDGTWTLEASGTTESFLSIGARSATDIYAVGYNGTILHSTGDGTWQPQNSGTTERLIEIHGMANELWVVGHNGTILRSTGDGTWQPQNSGVTFHLYAIRNIAGSMWAAGASNQILNSRGDGQWTVIETGLPVTAIDALWAFDGGRILAAAEPGVVIGELP